MSEFLNLDLSDFQSTNADTFSKNIPSEKEYSDRKSFLVQGIPLYTVTSGTPTHIRLIPWPKFGYFARKAAIHYGIGLEKNAYACLKMKGEEVVCPICKASRIAYQNSNKELGKALAASQRHLLIMVDRKAQVKGPQILTWSETAVNDLRNRMDDPITKAPRAVDDIRGGLDIMFTKRHKQQGAKFETVEDMFVSNQPSPLSTNVEEIKAWTDWAKEKLTDYLAIFDFATEAEMELALAGGDTAAMAGLSSAVAEDPFANQFQQPSGVTQAVAQAVQPSVAQLFGNAAANPPAPAQVNVPPVPAASVPNIPAEFQPPTPPAPAAVEVPPAPVVNIPAMEIQTAQPTTDSTSVRDEIRRKLEAQKAASN